MKLTPEQVAEIDERSHEVYTDHDERIVVALCADWRTMYQAIDQATTAYLRAKPGEDAGAKMFRILMDATTRGEQQMPRPGRENVTERVIEDLRKREQKGIETYGTTLQTFNGRDCLQDLYEELLDAAQYIKQYMMERDTCERDD